MVIDIGIIVLVFMSIALCVVLIVMLAKLAPPLLRSSRYLEKISGDVAAVSEAVTNDIATTARNASNASQNAVDASRNMVDASKDAVRAAMALPEGLSRVGSILGRNRG